MILGKFWQIQAIKEQVGFIEIKLEGTPFLPSLELDKTMKYLMCLILKKYSELGYYFKASIDIIGEDYSTDAVIFEKREPWRCNGEETVLSRRLVENILRLMRQYNWSLYATCKLSELKSAFFFRFDPTRLNNR